MTPPRHGRRIAVVVAPLAVLAVAWTSHQTVLGTTTADVQVAPAPTAVPERPVTLPDTPAAIEAPASLSGPARVGSGTVGSASLVAAGSTAAPGDIPAPALSAYQRAESIINAADAGCGVSWQLIAAIGSVESDHGRYGGSTLDAQGRATPAILGPVLDGGPGMTTIRDTDAGQYDADAAYDRAVGPMQFIPSTWAVAGVDADDDGRRDPQDIDDAALAAAVYLCSGSEDLSTRAGQEAAVHRYNHSDSYVATVLSRAQAYLEGDVVGGGSYASVVNAGALTPLTPLSSAPLRPAREAGGTAIAAGRTYRNAARAFDLAETTDPALTEAGSDDAEAVAGSESIVARNAGHHRKHRAAKQAAEPVELPAEQPQAADAEDTGDTEGTPVAQPAEPAPAEPAPTDVPAPAPEPAVPAPAPAPAPEPVLTSEEQAAADCAALGLVDDPAAPADDYDVCLAEQLGLPAPVDPAQATDPSPASTEPDA